MKIEELTALFPRARASVLTLLWMGPERGYHLRELARRSGLAIGTIQQEVSNLSSVELIKRFRDGNRLYYLANRGHPLYADIRGIILKTSGMGGVLKDALKSIEGIQLAWIFGSLASGDHTDESDIDLFVIGVTGLRQLAPVLRALTDQLAREINPVIMPEIEYRERLRKEDPFIETVKTSQKIWLIGSENELDGLAGKRLVASAQDEPSTNCGVMGDCGS